ncbi:MAG: hypothetical protein KAS23_09515 [Anaerohalosphaera sp.]|nr:hypothetical protein [Anaerohalosphaera sp.]
MNKSYLIACLVFVFSTNALCTTYFYSDTIEPNEIHDNVYVYCIDYVPTVIDMYGGEIQDCALLYDFSILNLHNGTLNCLASLEDTVSNIYGGTINSLEAQENSTSNIYDGVYYGHFSDDSSGVIYGGEMDYLLLSGRSTVIINGGKFVKVYSLIGNSCTPALHINKAEIADYLDFQSGEVHIYGNNFFYDESGGVYEQGQLTGQWYDGTSFSIDFYSKETFDHLHLHYPEEIICEQPIPADLNNDCKVNLEDLSIFCSYWLQCNLYPADAC